MDEPTKPGLTLEGLLYIAALILAAGLRFIALGSQPLADGEANLALQAALLARGEQAVLLPQAAYLVLTTPLFFLMGGSSTLARLWPALAGTLLVLAPLVARRRLGRDAALLLAFFIAFDPGLMALSRQADGRMLALTAAAFAVALFAARKVVGAGIAAGLALLGGPSTWLGTAGLALAGFVYSALHPAQARQPAGSLVGAFESAEPSRPARVILAKAAAWGGAAFVVVGSLFFTLIPALGAAAGSLAAFIEGLTGEQGQSVLLLLAAWAVSNPLAIGLALVEMIRAARSKERKSLRLAWWWFVAMLVVLVYPGHHTADLIWPGLPMLALAARAAARFFEIREEKSVFYSYAAMTLVLLGSMWLSLVGAVSAGGETEANMRLAVLLASFFLLLAGTFLVVWGWGVSVVVRGLRAGLAAILVIYVFAAAWDAAGLGGRPESELWRLDAYPKDADLLTATVRDFSMWQTGRPEVLDVSVIAIDQPSLFWALRGSRTVNRFSALPPDNTASVVITNQQEQLSISSPYSGQALTWNTAPDWQAMSARQWLKWIAFREAPLIRQPILLWVRTDLFPGDIVTAPTPQD